MGEPNWQIGLTFGLLLTAALLAGTVARWLRLPKVTAYLLVGLLLGPHTLQSLPEAVFHVIPRQWLSVTTIPEHHLVLFAPLAKLAMALVLFNMGCSFTLDMMRQYSTRILRLSAGELSATFVFVSVGLLLLRETWQAAVLFGALALATAPATTVLVFKEIQSEGRVTRYANMLVAVNNLVCVVVFELIFTGITFFEERVPQSATEQLERLAAGLAGSIALGVLAGLATTIISALVSRDRWLVVLVALTSLLLGLCQYWELPYLLTFLVMGTTLANTSDRTKEIVAELDHLTGLLCVVFFVIHGAEFDFRALLDAGLIGIGYIVLRTVGKYFGIVWASTRSDGPDVRRWLGATLMSQAGAAIALSTIAAQRDPARGEHLRDIIIGTVVFFEILGPLLIRRAVVRCGEVPVRSAIVHRTSSPLEELRALRNRVLLALGIEPWNPGTGEAVRIKNLMRTNIQAVPASANFRRVLAFLEHSHDNTLPVVNDEEAVIGVIRYLDLQGEYFDPGLGTLVNAEDLALASFPVVHPDDPISRAWREFHTSNDDCFPVVSREEPHKLLGIVRRRDVLRYSPPPKKQEPS